MSTDDAYLRSIETVEGGEGDRLPDDLLDELDKTLEGLTSETEGQVLKLSEDFAETAEGFSTDPAIEQMQRTFIEMVRQTLAPVERYMKAISQGETARELLEISEMVVTPLVPKIESVGLEKHADDLSFFRSLLMLALGERDQNGSRAMREVVMEGFVKLIDRFNVGFRGYRLAVRNLVQFYRAMKRSDCVSEADIRRFFALGIPSLTWVRRTKVSEMTSLSGIEPDVMTEIRRLAYMYRSVPPMRSARLAVEDGVASTLSEGSVSDASLERVDFLDPEMANVSIDPFRGTA